jgi:hypothetical protein
MGFCDSPGRCVGENRWGCCVVNVVKQHRSELRRGRVRSDQTGERLSGAMALRLSS